jgi:EAL domain-containing protein (putative c-di-GMP-specific phosphodiesterase class I)
MDLDHETHEIVRTIVMLAHSLGLKVVAEGIERQGQMATLQQLGCELGQGYLSLNPPTRRRWSNS